ncbi:MAG: glycosyltransferase [Microthrixaceae bacterium]|nr:glycosyltransferase [Microthrixaceae bacterium]MCO5314129.1 glycosyltransferase [Microthrixaceae bacterium]
MPRAFRGPHTSSTALDIGVYGARGVPSTYSGYETFLTLLLPELAKRGDRVTMYCRSGEDFTNDDWQGVHRKVLPTIPGKNFSTLSHGLVAGVAARFARHDVVLVVNVANAAYCALSRYTRQPVVLNVDGQEWLRGKWGNSAKTIFLRSAQISRHCASALIADGAAMADIYRDEFASDTTVIPYCVTNGDWTKDPATVQNLGLEPYRYLLIAGRHNPENNIDRIVRDYAAGSHPLPLVVLGTANYDSPVTTAIAELAERDERIRMLGHVGDRNAFFDLVHHAKVYLHGHSVGGTNPSLVEAMGTGSRIAAFDTAFSREVLGDNAEYFNLDETAGPNAGLNSLDRAVTTILDDNPTHDLHVRDQTAARAGDLYNVDDVVGAYRDLLAAAANSRRPVSLRTRWAAGTRANAASR